MMNNSNSDFSNFGRILKSLQMQNVSVPELRLLKQEHSYLQKLRQQRSKIQQLKAKYDTTEAQMSNIIEDNRAYKNFIDDQARTILELESQLEEQQNRRVSLEITISKQFDSEKDRNRQKMGQMVQQIEELRKVVKQKDVALFSLEEESNQQIHSLRDSFTTEKKRIIMDYQTKIREESVDKNDGELMELRNLISRQNKALKLQSEQYEQLSEKFNEISESNEQLQEDYERYSSENQVFQQKIVELSEQLESSKFKLESYEQDSQTRGQLEEIRKKMSELTKGEIERIEFIVNQFD